MNASTPDLAGLLDAHHKIGGAKYHGRKGHAHVWHTFERCDGCDWSGENGTFTAHLAAVLGPWVAEQRAEAFDRALREGDWAWQEAAKQHMSGRDELENP